VENIVGGAARSVDQNLRLEVSASHWQFEDRSEMCHAFGTWNAQADIFEFRLGDEEADCGVRGFMAGYLKRVATIAG
jgi:hypothetical protein